MIWPNGSSARVCTPGANQKVAPVRRKSKPLLSPAGTVTAPAGGALGPSSKSELPQTWAGGVVGEGAWARAPAAGRTARASVAKSTNLDLNTTGLSVLGP